jgi:hypothetical protein
MHRLLDMDAFDELRGKYLFSLGNLCHVNPNEVDDLRLMDFAQLVLGIDAYHAEVKRRNDE